MAEITFLAPGSCQLEVTAQGNVGTDTGVDLASVSWTIEQALIAGCRFSPSAGDVHIDRNGVLTIGRSLFDRINQADGGDAIPGQCTLVIRADSTITDNVLDRFKVLVGYPGAAGGGGGGGVQLGTVNRVYRDDGAAASGDRIQGGPAILTISIGNDVVTHWDDLQGRMLTFAAAGVTVSAVAGPYDAEMTNQVVVRTFTADGYNYGTISEPIDLPVSTSTMETPDGSMVVATFTMPELPDGTGILLSV